LKFKKGDLAFIIIIAILTIISFDLLFNKTHQEAIENISKYEPFQNLGTGLLITFWVCVIGNLLPFPTPYTWVVCYSSQPFITNLFIPLLIGFIASLGCLIGEIGGYIIGRVISDTILEDTRKEKLKKFQQYLIDHPRLAPLLIFIAALTPISDDLIVIPLGIIKYSPKKTIFWCWLGKFGLMLVFAYNLINICNLIGGESWILSVITLYVLVILIYGMTRINFFKDKKKEINKND